jgi:two-component system, cell cycle response regulator
MANVESDAGSRPSLVLIIDSQEWSSRALETCLAPAGYAVLRAYNGQQGIERATTGRPDIIVIGTSIPDMSVPELCRRLIAAPPIGAGTPLIATGYGPVVKSERLAALNGGAWDYVLLPPDPEELMAKFRTWSRTRRALERAREISLVDEATGAYNARGLLQRADELAAEAARFGKPLSCVVFTVDPTPTPGGTPDERVIAAVCEAMRQTVRTCDSIGRLTADQFAVLAPSTDTDGALRLAERVLACLDDKISAGQVANVQIKAGYSGVIRDESGRIDPAELVARAIMAIHKPAPESANARIHAYRSRSRLN